MNTAIGVEKFTDMGEGLAGGIAGLWCSAGMQPTERTVASAMTASSASCTQLGAQIWGEIMASHVALVPC